jgi:hypothetical protein
MRAFNSPSTTRRKYASANFHFLSTSKSYTVRPANPILFDQQILYNSSSVETDNSPRERVDGLVKFVWTDRNPLPTPNHTIA